MKTLNIVLLTAAAGLALSAPATAEWFNDRGDHFTTQAPAGTQKPQENAPPAAEGFIVRGQEFTVVAPAGSDRPRQPAPARPKSFNERSDFVDELHGPWVPGDGAN